MFHVEQSFSPERICIRSGPSDSLPFPPGTAPAHHPKTNKVWFWVVFHPRKTARQRKNHLHID